MGHSSLLGTDDAPQIAAGRDTRALGPSDTSDSGSDLVGIDDLDDGDPGMPVDVATSSDRERPGMSAESTGADTDAAGTGERRSAAGDAGLRDGSDIGVDHIIESGDPSDDGDASLDALANAPAGDPLDDELDADVEDAALDLDALPEDESADPVGIPRRDRTER